MKRSLGLSLAFTSMVAAAALVAACAPPGSDDGGNGGSGADKGTGPEIDVSDPGINPGGNPGNGQIVDDPTNCDDAAASRSYIGCDFWPTITANPVWEEFEYAVVVANPQDAAVTVNVEGPAAFSTSVEVAAGGLQTIYLPWVGELKGPEYDLPRTTGGRLQNSQTMEGGAYHMTASAPITAWQFSPLHYRKDRGLEPGQCGARIEQHLGAAATECRAASNDASLLLPSTAMTGNYRVAAYSGARGDENWGSAPGAFAITATKDNTTVSVQLPPNCDAVWLDKSNGCILASPDGVVSAGVAGDVFDYTMNAGDVIQIQGAYGTDPQVSHADISGTLINATQPIQVIAFNSIVNIPDETGNADHVEETILPAEVLGNRYFVVPPTAYNGRVSGHIVRIYGSVDGTVLTYPSGKPAGAPDSINAGEVVELPGRASNNQCPSFDETCVMTESFEIQGDQPFVVGSFQVGGKIQVPNYPEEYAQPGDPAFSQFVTPEQFRTSYTFLAPADFLENWADIVAPEGAEVVLDGEVVSGSPSAIGTSGWVVHRVQLTTNKPENASGIHTLTTSDERGVGLQVSGYGSATSYYYPGGMNLKAISPPPVIPR